LYGAARIRILAKIAIGAITAAGGSALHRVGHEAVHEVCSVHPDVSIVAIVKPGHLARASRVTRDCLPKLARR
jgi:hypothetical protein